VIAKVILVSFGTLLLFVGCRYFFDAKRIWSTYRRIYGIVSQNCGKGGSGFAPVVSYQINGMHFTYKSDIRSDWTARLKVGAECPILIHPTDNNKVLDGRSGYFWMRACAPTACGVIAIVIGYFWR
jgi:hypothetical protein